MNKSRFAYTAISLIVAVGLGFWLAKLTSPGDQQTAESERTPLYWVAPMDPNYKSDKPGTSPMGMELIPVYEEGPNGEGEGPGTISISPDVVNNLGVRTAQAELRRLHSEIKTVGYVQYDEDHLVHVHPRVEGWIEKLYVKAEGDPVQKGEPIYDIYSPALVNAEQELILALSRKNQRLIKAAEDRLKSLQIPESAIQRLKETKKEAQNITFFAPQSGVLDNLNIREGFHVKPGMTLMSIGTLDEVWVEAEVFERQATLVKVGSPTTMTLDYLPGQTWRGSVDYVYPSLDPKTRTVKVRLRFKNKDKALKPNMFAQVSIHAESDEALLIPREAVIRSGTKDRVVYALGDGKFKSIEVKVGRFDEEFAEILEGLNEGERVVSSAQFLLDSESSKTSDFKRMHHKDADGITPATVWVQATINHLMADHRMLGVTHQAIEEWQWPEMNMEFPVSDSVDFSKLNQGMTLHLEISKEGSNQYLITNIHIPETQSNDLSHELMPGTNHEGMSHEGMSHEGMSHEGMSHEGMNHEGMNHEGMNHEGMNHEENSEHLPEKMNHAGMDHSGHTE